MNRQQNQVHFSGEAHGAFRTEEETMRFARGLMDRFETAVPGLDNLIIGWWDGSADKDDGGIGLIVDVCLPGVPNFSIVKARPVKAHGSSVVVELNGCLETCFTIRKMLQKCQARGILKDVVGPLDIILVTDCMPIVDDMRAHTRATEKAAQRREPLLRRIKILSDQVLDIGPFVKLNMYHCRRNRVERTERVDLLSREARLTQKSHRSTIEYDGHAVRARAVKNDFNHYADHPHTTTLEAELRSALSLFPRKCRTKREMRKRKQYIRKAGKPVVIVVDEEVEDDEEEDEEEDALKISSRHRHKRRRIVNSSSEAEEDLGVVEH